MKTIFCLILTQISKMEWHKLKQDHKYNFELYDERKEGKIGVDSSNFKEEGFQMNRISERNEKSRRNEPSCEALLNFYTFPLIAVIFSLLEEKRGGHLEESYLQVVLTRVQFKSRSSICFTFQDERLLGFTLVT